MDSKRQCLIPESCKAKGLGLCRSCKIKALNSDPEFAAKRDARGSARMKALNLDPEFAAKRKLRDAKRLDTLKKRRLEKGI